MVIEKIIYNLRYLYKKISTKKINKGNNVRINVGVNCYNHSNIYIGDNTYINGGSIVAGDSSKVFIGKDCLISYNVHIRTVTHNYKNKDTLIRMQGNLEENIVIGDDVWIGYGVQILPEVKIGNGAVIGAGAIVTKNVEEYAIAVGCPAKVIGFRR